MKVHGWATYWQTESPRTSDRRGDPRAGFPTRLHSSSGHAIDLYAACRRLWGMGETANWAEYLQTTAGRRRPFHRPLVSPHAPMLAPRLGSGASWGMTLKDYFCRVTVVYGFVCLTSLCVLGQTVSAQTPDATPERQHEVLRVDGPSQDALAAQQRLRVAPGLEVRLWASEPLVENITSVDFDGQGRAYVVETGRRRTSVFDIRGLSRWLDDDFALRTVADRAEFLKRNLTPGTAESDAFIAAVNRGDRGGFIDFNQDGVVDWRDLEQESERIRLVWASDSALAATDAKRGADSAKIFVDGFNSRVSGVAACVLAQGGQVWFTCIPDLWRFTGASFDADPVVPGRAKSENHLLTGFGVHVAFGGHDLHGLALGPDGRLYFSIADRGTHVTNRENAVIALPDTGAVFRSEPDGTHFEIVARGLRNPQELAFDDHGNLWTGDNNGDGGDKARWTLVLDGADYGWTLGWQWVPRMGAWNSERLWGTRETNTAAWIVPPVAHVGHGPAGIAWYPGTGLGDAYRDHFFYADFPGGIRTFAVEPDGAFFKVRNGGAWLEDNSPDRPEGKLLWDLSPVDVTFPPFGGVIVGDWIRGWEKTGLGRLWHVVDPRLDGDPTIAETARLLAECAGPNGWKDKSVADLGTLLAHRDQRVRQAAQFELATRPAETLWRQFEDHPNSRVRWHLLYALEQQRRAVGLPDSARGWLESQIKDRDVEIRALAAKFMGEWYGSGAAKLLVELIRNEVHPRVRAAALMALKPDEESIRSGAFDLHALPVLESVLGAQQGPRDPVLFHAVTRVLERVGAVTGERSIEGILRRGSVDLRLAAVVAARRLQHPALITALNDPHPQVVLEAVRAIHDKPGSVEVQPMTTAERNLMGRLNSEGKLQAGWTTWLRKTEDGGNSLDATKTPWPQGLPFAAREWEAWVVRRLINLHLKDGNAASVETVAAVAMGEATPESVRMEAIEALGLWMNPPRRDRVTGLHQVIHRTSEPTLQSLVLRALDNVANALLGKSETIAAVAPPLKRALIESMVRMEHPATVAWAQRLVSDPDKSVRDSAIRAIPQGTASDAELKRQVESDESVLRRQSALTLLSTRDNPKVDDWILEWIQAMEAGEWEADMALAVELEMSEAIQRRGNPKLIDAWAKRLDAATDGEQDAKYRVVLRGGDAIRGRRLFEEQADWGCARCHKLDGLGGDVGPDLTGIGSRQVREKLLESIVAPNAQIAVGYETVLLTLDDGDYIAGVVREETDDVIRLSTAESGVVALERKRVVEREPGMSAMPDGLAEFMTMRDLRDLIEALAESR